MTHYALRKLENGKFEHFFPCENCSRIGLQRNQTVNTRQTTLYIGEKPWKNWLVEIAKVIVNGDKG